MLLQLWPIESDIFVTEEECSWKRNCTEQTDKEALHAKINKRPKLES